MVSWDVKANTFLLRNPEILALLEGKKCKNPQLFKDQRGHGCEGDCQFYTVTFLVILRRWLTVLFINSSAHLIRMIRLISICREWRLVLVTSRAPTDAARTIRVSMEEPAKKSVSPRVFGTTVLFRYSLLENAARLCWDEVVRNTKQLGSTYLNCTKLSMTAIKPSKFSVILIQSPGSRRTWSSHLAYPTSTILR